MEKNLWSFIFAELSGVCLESLKLIFGVSCLLGVNCQLSLKGEEVYSIRIIQVLGHEKMKKITVHKFYRKKYLRPYLIGISAWHRFGIFAEKIVLCDLEEFDFP